MTTERIDELIALAALGELTPAEEAELTDAARRDPQIAAELDDALAAAAAIHDTAGLEPPSGLRASVLAVIAATPQETSQAVSPAASSMDVASPDVVSLDERRTRRRVMPWVAGAAAVAVFVIGAFVVSEQASAPDPVDAVLEADDAEQHRLSGELGGTLTITYSPSHSAFVVEGDGVPVPADDSTYQLWVDIDGHMTPAGLFRPGDDGRVEARIDGIETTGESINVTLEPAGGSDEPTLPVLASA